MNARDMIKALGVSIIERQSFSDNITGEEVGCSPSSYAEIRIGADGVPAVWVFADMGAWEQYFADVLHEALHVVVGPDSLGDDGPVMAMQAALIRHLDLAERLRARQEFADFGFGWTHPITGEEFCDVTISDDVFLSEEWKRDQELAVQAGFLVYRLGKWEPVFGHGPHPDWASWWEAKQTARAARADFRVKNARSPSPG